MISAGVWAEIARVWNSSIKLEKSPNFVYIGDEVTVVRGRKVPIGTKGKVVKMWENPYCPITDDRYVGALTLNAVGVDVEAIQTVNSKVQLELADGSKVCTYLRNLDKWIEIEKRIDEKNK